MIGGTLSPGPEKLKISKCSVLNQISGEGCFWIVKVLHGLISPRNLSQSDIFMFQVRYIHFLKFWAEQIQALPNSVWWFPNSRILFPTSPNMSKKPIQIIQNSRNKFYSPILHLLIDSSPWVIRKNNEFHKYTFSNLVFGDEFACNRTIWIHHGLFHVLETKFQFKEVMMMF